MSKAPIFSVSNEIPSAKISTFLRKSAKNSKSILNLTSMRTPVDHLSTNEITATLNQMVLDPSVVRQTSGKNVVKYYSLYIIVTKA